MSNALDSTTGANGDRKSTECDTKSTDHDILTTLGDNLTTLRDTFAHDAKVDLRRIVLDFLTSGIRVDSANPKPTDDRPWELSRIDRSFSRQNRFCLLNDLDGNQVGKSKSGESWSYAYDHRGQMTQATSDTGVSVAYKFDAFGNRIERDATVGGVSSVEKFVVDGWDTAKPGAVGTENFDVAIDLDASGNVANRRMFGAGFDELLCGQDGTGAVRWYGTDHLGSVRTVFDNSGTVTNTVDYDAFGAFLGGVPVDRYAYTGREYDSVTGLTHYRAREKDGHRFLSEDPKGFSAGDPNLARYVGNSPTNGRDPSGLQGRPPLNTNGVPKQITEKESKEETKNYWNKVRLGREFRKYERLNKAIQQIEASPCSDDQVVQKHLAIMKLYRDWIRPAIEPKGWTGPRHNDFRHGGEGETPVYDVPDHELPEALLDREPEGKPLRDDAFRSEWAARERLGVLRNDAVGSQAAMDALGVASAFDPTGALSIVEAGAELNRGNPGAAALAAVGAIPVLGKVFKIANRVFKPLNKVKQSDEYIQRFNFGDHLRGLIGDHPKDMIDPHAHHILFKKGLGAAQQALVCEGQAILRKVGIDPIFGKENLVWAPWRVVKQHGPESLKKVVEKLRELDKAGADYDDFVKALNKLGKEAARRSP